MMEVDDEANLCQPNILGSSGTRKFSLNPSSIWRNSVSHTAFSMPHSAYDSRPNIRKTPNLTEKIKQTLCEISVKCNISDQASQLVFQTTYSSFYSNEYYLTKTEVIEKNQNVQRLMF